MNESRLACDKKIGHDSEGRPNRECAQQLTSTLRQQPQRDTEQITFESGDYVEAVRYWIAPDETFDDEELPLSSSITMYKYDSRIDLYTYDSKESGDSWVRRLIHRVADALIAAQMKFLAAVSAVDEFMQLWTGSRPRRLVRIGLWPAVLAVGFMLAMNLARNVSRPALVDQYRRAASLASNRGDDAAARLWLQKVAWLDPTDPDYQYRLALAAAHSGDWDRAKQIMHQLAPDDRAGYGPAHFWQAEQIVAEHRTIPRTRIPVLRNHLKQAVAHNSQNAEAAEMLAQLEIQDGNVDQAISALKPVVRYYPELRLMLAGLYRINNDFRRASSIAESGLGIFQQRIEKDPDSVADRVHCARLLTFQKRFELALVVLQEGAARLQATAAEVPGQEWEEEKEAALNQLRMELSNMLIAWHDCLRHDAPHDYTRRLHVLQLAANAAPSDQRVLERLALLAAEGPNGATDAREALSDALANGTAPATVHLLLSLDAKNRRDCRAEEQHLRLALLLNPRLAAAANNLAWLLAHDDPSDLDGALELIEQAADVAPNHPEIRATRGVIYRKLGRTEEAIVDLESALVELRNRADIHRELAGLYDTLGNRELAERHRTRATAESASDRGTAG